jgi:isoleucyl-tRNA synthetase
LDRWILGEFEKLEKDVIAAYDKYEFHVVYQRLSQFVAVELSAIYHDVIKDRLYTDPANFHRRRSTQTALHRLVTGLCQLLAPILSFTADEAWEFLPMGRSESVHETKWQSHGFKLSDEEQATWQALFAIREIFLGSLEGMRQSKIIGKSLEAKVTVEGNASDLVTLAKHREEFRELLNVSQLAILASASPNEPKVAKADVFDGGKKALVHLDPTTLSFSGSKADGQKCERCWHWETDVGANAEHPTLCGRCVKAVTER